MTPKVSIIIPVYNGSNYLSQAIDSALSQTYENIEVLVINDGSTDNGLTENIALSYGDKIKYFHKTNGGIASALNYGIEKMSGDYFSWLSHDDLYEHNKIEKQVNSLSSNDELSLCFGSIMDENCNLISRKQRMIKGKITGLKLFKEFLKGLNLNGLCFLIPKKIFTEIGGFDGEFKYLQDLEMWLRIFSTNPTINCLNETLTLTRIHKNQLTNLKPHLYIDDIDKLAEKHGDLVNHISNLKVKNALIKYYYLLFIKDNNSKGINLFKRIIKENHSHSLFLCISIMKYKFLGKVTRLARKIKNARLTQKNLRS